MTGYYTPRFLCLLKHAQSSDETDFVSHDGIYRLATESSLHWSLSQTTNVYINSLDGWARTMMVLLAAS
jgi:hypothetical protein